jgi:hypothetical protein
MTTPAQIIQFDNGRAEIFPTHALVYTIGEHPVVTFAYSQWAGKRCWSPSSAEYGSDHRQIVELSASEAAARCCATESLIRQIEAAVQSHHAAGQAAIERRIEGGRRAWAALPKAEQDALNGYALRTEGHTID